MKFGEGFTFGLRKKEAYLELSAGMKYCLYSKGNYPLTPCIANTEHLHMECLH